ncbi:hypothetical protein ARALYDRAFT_916268 [Arabidopsis lyrata subsp. lyrata]|uniref:FBD domain-containing protein n=2 Tax=Arabidopsis lyrata subsp. lyrata TaxID=81972 RepID=D7MJD4_ARALL|nr:hypothetical protein ARALYDRAFT_916268 [Arabidopsis lyrata subsp. lyrata]
MVPRLEYKESKDSDHESVWWFLEKSLQQHKAPILESLSIKLDQRCPIDADVKKWIANAVDRRVRMLNLILMWSAAPIDLPASLYTCETLVELNLCREILLDVPSSVCLTSLKKLYLSGLMYKDEVSAVRLLSSCPVLEQLSVSRSRNDNVTNFIVEVPSLKNLLYSKERSDIGDTGGSLVIDCPALKDLFILDSSGGSCSSRNMPCLDRVLISTVWYPDEKFLIPFSSITCLKLCMTHAMVDVSAPRTFVFYFVITLAHLLMLMYTSQVDCCSAVYFPRLTVLNIIWPLDTDWMEPLLLLLKNSPILKNILITNLAYRGRTEEKEFATYILGNSKCLKYAEFLISCNNLEKKTKIREDLNSMSRVSTSKLKVLRD